MDKKLTREEKKAAEARERLKAQAMEFRAKTERARSLVVVAKASDMFTHGGLHLTVAEPLRGAAYNALEAAERLVEEYRTKLSFLRNKVDDAERNLAEGRYYTSTAMQNVDDLQQTYGRLLEARSAAKSILRATGLYCEALEEKRDHRDRLELLSYAVEPVVQLGRSAEWMITVNGNPAAMPGTDAAIIHYTEEWLAWRALMTLLDK